MREFHRGWSRSCIRRAILPDGSERSREDDDLENRSAHSEKLLLDAARRGLEYGPSLNAPSGDSTQKRGSAYGKGLQGAFEVPDRGSPREVDWLDQADRDAVPRRSHLAGLQGSEEQLHDPRRRQARPREPQGAHGPQSRHRRGDQDSRQARREVPRFEEGEGRDPGGEEVVIPFKGGEKRPREGPFFLRATARPSRASRAPQARGIP